MKKKPRQGEKRDKEICSMEFPLMDFDLWMRKNSIFFNKNFR